MEPVSVEVLRGNLVESRHRVHFTVVNTKGEVVFSRGNSNYETFWRSAAKPFQAVPLLDAGGQEKFNFIDEEIALFASSHSGEKEHIRVLESILKKIGLVKEVQANGHYISADNPCSGKHAGMIALGKLLGFDLKNYRDINHPVQQLMLESISQVVGIDKGRVILGIDGCGVPVFGMPIYNMALAYAILGKHDRFEGGRARANSLTKVFKAMTNKPFIVGGSNQLDSILMDALKGRIVAKSGVEGIFCVGIAGDGIGIALKVEDGNYRAIAPVIIPLLNKLGYLPSELLGRLAHRAEPEIKNHRGDVVGRIKQASL